MTTILFEYYFLTLYKFLTMYKVFVRRHSVHFHFTFMHITINMKNAFNLKKFIKLQLFLFEQFFCTWT